MLEKALISGVVHQREETVYRVEGTTAAQLFGALAEASVNVDTIVQTNAEIVFSAPVEDRADASRTLDALGVSWTSRDDLGKVSLVGAGMKSHPGVAAKTFATLEQAGNRGVDRLHLADQDRVPRPLHRRRPGRPGPARGVRAWLTTRASGSSAPPARSGRSRWSFCASAATATCACSPPRAPRGSSWAGRPSRRRRRRRSPPAISISASSRSAPRRASSSFHTPSDGGAVCVDKSAAYRLEPGIPLVVPEVNGIRAAEHQGIVANPNCCAIPLTCALKPLHDAVGLERIRVATYQSVSGAGAQAMERLRAQTPEENDLRMDWDFDGVEFDEEEKLREETRKILELPALPVSATCVRVPILVGHAEAVWIETKEPLSAEQATSILGGAPGLRLEQFPTPGGAAGGDDVLVGRIRKRPDDRERARTVHRRRQPAQGRGAERNPDRRASAGTAARRGLILATIATALSLLAPAQPTTLIAAGDIASCRSSGDERTAALVARIPGTVAVLGDAVYERGNRTGVPRLLLVGPFPRPDARRTRQSRVRLRRREGCDRLLPPPRSGYYSYDLGDWHVVVLNSNCRPAGGCGRGSPQQRWLAADLAANPASCTVAYMHHPRFSSGLHGSDTTLGSLWTTLSRGGADIVLAGHDHHYERFAPFEGIRTFVVGTGGRSHYPVLFRLSRPKSVGSRRF